MQKSPRVYFFILLLAASAVSVTGCGNKGSKSTGSGSSGGSAIIATSSDSISYSIGVNFGRSFKDNKIELNTDVFARAINDVLEDSTLALDETAMMQVLQNFETTHRAKLEAERAKQTTENLLVASTFLAENAQKPGIVTLPDSLQYEVIKDGTGATPTQDDRVKVDYVGTLIDGKEFDSSKSLGEPSEFQVNQVIKGWQEVLQLMKVGSHWKVYIPPQLAYGENSPPTIPPNSLLIMEIELLDIVKGAE